MTKQGKPVTRLAALCAALVVLVLLAAMPLGVSAAAEDAVFGLVGGTGEVGDEVQTHITVNPNTYVCNFTMLVNYDPTVLEFVSCTQGEVTQGGMMASTANVDEKVVKIAFAVITPIIDGGDMFLVNFRVLKKEATALSLGMKECDGEITENGVAKGFSVKYTLGSAMVNEGSTPVTQPTAAPQTSTATQGSKATETTKAQETTKEQTTKATKFTGSYVVVTESNGTPVTNAQGSVVTKLETVRTSVLYVTQADGTPATDAQGKTVTEVVTLSGDGGQFPVWAIIALVAALAAMGAAGFALLHNKKPPVSPESELASEPEPEAESEAESEPETESEPEPEADSDTQE